MIKITLRILAIVFIAWMLFFIYFEIVSIKAQGYFNEAAFKYRMATIKNRYHRSEADQLAHEADSLKDKGYKTLALLPKFLQPK